MILRCGRGREPPVQKECRLVPCSSIFPNLFISQGKPEIWIFLGNHLILKCWLNLKIEATLGVLKVLILTEGIYELFICILQMRRQRLCNSPTARMPDQDTYPNSLAPEPVLFSTAPICCLDLAHGPVVCDLWQVSERRRGPGAEPWP